MRKSRPTVLCLLAAACSLGAEPPTAEVYLSDGRTERLVAAEHTPRLERALRGLLASCSSNNSEWAGSSENWHAAEAKPSILVRYPAPISVRTLGEEIEIDTILFAPLSPDHLSADHVFARRGERIYAFAKWNPKMGAALICDPYIELKRHIRVREFCEMMGAS